MRTKACHAGPGQRALQLQAAARQRPAKRRIGRSSGDVRRDRQRPGEIKAVNCGQPPQHVCGACIAQLGKQGSVLDAVGQIAFASEPGNTALNASAHRAALADNRAHLEAICQQLARQRDIGRP